nr:hypothetical protein [Sedimentibacter sp.]
MNWIRNFMIGRHGIDQLNMAILILGMIVTFIGDILSSSILMLATYIIFGIGIFRILSKDTSSRQKENYIFLNYWNPVYKWLKIKYQMVRGNKTYKYFNCPNCKKMIRAPKGRGKIIVTCQKCKTKFTEET